MRPTVFLFDIDGTLLLTGGAGRRAMRGAFDDVFGEGGAVALDFPFAGMTDRAIVRQAMATAAAAVPDDAAIDHLLEVYLSRLDEEVRTTATYRVLPGVVGVLSWLTALVGPIAIGLGTGNVKRGAYAKLARGSLHTTFRFGGFGCDAESRTELLRVGASRGASSLGLPMAECRVVVIGDTPKDVSAAEGIGAECVGVGTGGFEPRALLELGARSAFATLEEDGVREALFGP